MSPPTPGSPRAANITGSTITVGLPPEQVQALVLAFTQQIGAAGEARAKAEADAARLAAQLGFTTEAVVGFFRILGERAVPPEQMPTRLGEIATRYRDLTDRLATLDPDDPAAGELVDQARAAIETGRYDEADGLLERAEEVEWAAARQAEELARQAQEAADRHALKAAATRAQRGQVALTRLRYQEAAQHFATAAAGVPTGHEAERLGYLEGEADALYLQGEEGGDDAAFAAAIERYRELVGFARASRRRSSGPRPRTTSARRSRGSASARRARRASRQRSKPCAPPSRSGPASGHRGPGPRPRTRSARR